MGYSAKALANYFLDVADSERKPITPLKIQKLVYLAHGWYLGIYDSPLVGDEYAEAWQYGPVFPSLYHEFKVYGNSPIEGRALELVSAKRVAGRIRLKTHTPKVDENDDAAVNCLRSIWEQYGPLTGGQLSSITHRQGSPWDVTAKCVKRKLGQLRKNQTIKDTTIRDYYQNLLNET